MKTELDSQTKQLLQEVASITGVDVKLINTVLENLLIAWLLKILRESSEKKLVTIPIPYIGNIGIKYNGEQLSSDSTEIFVDADYFISMSDSFKKLIRDIYEGKSASLAEIIRAKIIKDVSGK
jgi:predicted glycosyltransferase involved in capsule biosynthesis